MHICAFLKFSCRVEHVVLLIFVILLPKKILNSTLIKRSCFISADTNETQETVNSEMKEEDGGEKEEEEEEKEEEQLTLDEYKALQEKVCPEQ